MVDQLTLSTYEELLHGLRQAGYRDLGFEELDGRSSTKRCFVLRHDVDVSIDNALMVAELEGAAGVSAIYFFLLRSPLYNLLDRTSEHKIRRIHDLGHEVALHFDPSVYQADSLSHLTSEIEILVTCYPFANPTWVSFHKPGNSARNLSQMKLPGGLRHTYEQQFFNGLAYFSDSRGQWGHGNPLMSQDFQEGRGMQILTHPVWWCNQGNTALEKLDRQLHAYQEQRRKLVLADILPG